TLTGIESSRRSRVRCRFVGWVEPTGRANARPMTGSAKPITRDLMQSRYRCRSIRTATLRCAAMVFASLYPYGCYWFAPGFRTTSRPDKACAQIDAAVDHDQRYHKPDRTENGDLLERIDFACDTKCAGQHIGDGGHDDSLRWPDAESATLPETSARRLQVSLFSAYGLLYFYLATFSFGRADAAAGC